LIYVSIIIYVFLSVSKFSITTNFIYRFITYRFYIRIYY